MFNVVYRWRVHEGQEARFEAAWRELTARIRDERGGLGSKLHRCPDGSYLAYAQWPDRETWVRSQATPFAPNEASSVMTAAIAAREEPIELTPVADLLVG
jgi:quinol monooxygenase YgiN